MKKVLITSAVAEFEKDNKLRGLASETLSSYAEKLSIFLSWLPAHIKFCKQLTRSVYDDYVIYLRERFPNVNSINTTLRPFRRFLSFCAELDYLVPFKTSLVKSKDKVKPTYDLEMFRSVIYDRKELKQSVMCLLFLSTGIRSKTLRLLRVSDFDYSNRLLLLSHLKNNEQALLPLPVYTCNRLRRYISESGLVSSDLLFPTRAGLAYTRHSLYHYLGAYLKRHGFDSGGIHKFRHTFGKYFALSGGSSIALSHFLTHSSVAQSEKYTALYGQELRPFVSLVPAELLRTMLEQNKKDGD